MKKLIFISLLFVFVISCKSSSSPVETKLDKKTEVSLKGNWVLSKVSYPGSEYFKITSFNVADSKCFEGSQWKFVSNNNSGEMILTAANCTSYGSRITWYVNKEGSVVMKFLADGVKAKHTASGYVLKVANVTGQSFQLVDKMNVGGQMTDVVYQFSKI